MAQIVDILTNPVMPGIVKIGKTNKEDVMDRVDDLFETGVPAPFDCAYACEVRNNNHVEKELHAHFAKYRVSPRREFFWLKTRTAIKALKAYEITDVTPDIRAVSDSQIPEEDKNARWKARQKAIKNHPEYALGKDMHTKIRKSND
jgi:hypothetical protein